MRDEIADRERRASDIPEELRERFSSALDKIKDKIERKMERGKDPLLVAIDGGSGAGKSTLALLIAAEVPAVIVQGDDFYQTEINWNQKNATEKAELVIDWKRARKEALEPLLAGKKASWHPFNFATGKGLADYLVVRHPAPVILLDGVYSANPLLEDLIAVSILVDAPFEVRSMRHNEREGHEDKDWHALWDEAEAYYFSKVRTSSFFDIAIST